MGESHEKANPVRQVERHGPSSVDWARIVGWLTKWILPAYFAAFSLALLVYFVGHGLVGIDARIYTHAAASWLSGGDPWVSSVQGFLFAAPPPTLLPFVPFAVLGETLSSILWVTGSLAAGMVVIRTLKLPPSWILFPPLVNGILAGNADVVVVAALLRGGPVAATLASFLKIYAVVPLIGEGRWRALGITAAALAGTALFLPWGVYLAQSDTIAQTLARQAMGLSAYGTPWLMAVTAVALATLGPRLAGWLAVPTLWPSTQLHYSTLAMPTLASFQSAPTAFLISALLFAPPVRWLPAVAAILLAIGVIGRGLRQGKRKNTGRTKAVASP
jgi:hypothetical protein